MNIEIRQKGEETSWEELTNLFHEAFQERLDQGLNFTCSFFTPEDLERRSDNNIVLVAIDKDNGMLVGTAFVEIKHDEKGNWGYLSNMAIKPSYKRYGIGSKLEEHRIAHAKANNCDYVISDTAVGADSSVKWHHKNGFKKYELFSYQSTNYYSYIFRKELKPTNKLVNQLFCSTHFLLSALKCRLCFHKNGDYTMLMKAYLKLRGAN